MMSRKHYTAIANILSNYQEVMEADEYFEMVIDFGKMMRLDNDLFDLSRFMIACGIDTKALVTQAMNKIPQPKPASEHVSLA